MIRRACCAVALAALLISTAFADKYIETCKKVDADKGTLTFEVDGKERTFKVDAGAKFENQVKAGKRFRLAASKDGLKGIKAGDEITVTTERKDGAEVVTHVVKQYAEKK
jgi:Cu/Ag efflux protein CusF